METTTIEIDKNSEATIRKYLPTNDVLYDLSNFFSAFSDASRVKILLVLCIRELCVSDIASLVHMNQSTVSHQLRVLKNLNLVNTRRLGKIIFYSLKTNYVEDVMNIGVKYLGL